MRYVLGAALVAAGVGIIALAAQNHLGDAWRVISR